MSSLAGVAAGDNEGGARLARFQTKSSYSLMRKTYTTLYTDSTEDTNLLVRLDHLPCASTDCAVGDPVKLNGGSDNSPNFSSLLAMPIRSDRPGFSYDEVLVDYEGKGAVQWQPYA